MLQLLPHRPLPGCWTLRRSRCNWSIEVERRSSYIGAEGGCSNSPIGSLRGGV